MTDQPVSYENLVEWKREIASFYWHVRNSENSQDETLAQFRCDKDELFRRHPASPIHPEERQGFSGLNYYEYQPMWRVHGEVGWRENTEQFTVRLPEGDATMLPVADISFESPFTANTNTLRVYWLKGYGGGLFLPFKDGTSSASTYGGGRYLYDTIKGADPGFGNPVVLDFNYAYNPSCAYNSQWVCPLAPPENAIGDSVEAGEKAWGSI